MNPKTTGLLALVALALGAFVYLYEIGGDPQRAAEKDEAGRVFSGLDSADMLAIELVTQEGQDARFELREGEWRVTHPVDAPADATALDAISHALTHLPREGDVKSPRALEEYGLGDSARVIRFEVQRTGGVEENTLRIGRSTPVGGHLYVSREGDEGVAFVESYRLNAFNRNLSDLRERRIFGFEVGAVERLVLDWSGESEGIARERVEVKRGDDGLWRMTGPVEARADQEAIREVLSNLSFLRAQRFEDQRTADLDASLSDPIIKMEWELESGETAIARIAVAASADELLVDAGGAGSVVYGIAAERLDDFSRTINAYRFKQLASFELVAARRIEFELRSRKDVRGDVVNVSAALEEAGWTSADRSLDPDALSDFVRDLSTLRASDIFADEMGDAERASLGLAEPASVIRVFGEAGASPLAEIALGRLDDRHGLFVQRADDTTIYLVPSDIASELPTSLEAFESRFEVGSAELADGDAGDAGDADGAGDGGDDGLQEYDALDEL